jgi:predicted nucleic acid-binding protein
MNAVDTNVLIYSLDQRDPVKQNQARTLLRRLNGNATKSCIPWQVLGELARQLRTWQDLGKLTYSQSLSYIMALDESFLSSCRLCG